jgi:uncharacterized protein (TIGR01244 family)
MKIAHVAPDLGLTPQLSPEDLPEVAAAGFRSVVNNRPDQEEPGQPSSGELRIAAERCGLAYRHIPVTAGQIGDPEVAAFEHALRQMPKPLLAFCRTGTRAASLWALVEARRYDVDAIIAAAESAGYSLESLRPRLKAIAAESDANQAAR